MNKAKVLVLMLKALLMLITDAVTTAKMWLTNAFDDAKQEVYSMRLIGKLMLDTRAEGVGAGVVGTIVGIMVSLLIAIIIVVNLVNSQTPDATWSADANTTWTSLQSNIWVALGLLVIVPIVIGAVIILSYVRKGM